MLTLVFIGIAATTLGAVSQQQPKVNYIEAGPTIEPLPMADAVKIAELSLKKNNHHFNNTFFPSTALFHQYVNEGQKLYWSITFSVKPGSGRVMIGGNVLQGLKVDVSNDGVVLNTSEEWW